VLALHGAQLLYDSALSVRRLELPCVKLPEQDCSNLSYQRVKADDKDDKDSKKDPGHRRSENASTLEYRQTAHSGTGSASIVIVRPWLVVLPKVSPYRRLRTYLFALKNT